MRSSRGGQKRSGKKLSGDSGIRFCSVSLSRVIDHMIQETISEQREKRKRARETTKKQSELFEKEVTSWRRSTTGGLEHTRSS